MRADLELYSYAQLARAWSVSVRTVQRWLDAVGAKRLYRPSQYARRGRRAYVRGDAALRVCRERFAPLYGPDGTCSPRARGDT